MTRKLAFLVTAVVLLAAALPATAQQSENVRRIGYLSRMSASATAPWRAALLKGLRDLNWINGRNIVVEYRDARGNNQRLAELAADLVRRNVDVIVTQGGLSARFAQRLSKTVPIVMAEASAPIARGLIESLARPGANITGLSLMPTELFGKWLELLKESTPQLSRVAVLWNPRSPASTIAWKASRQPAQQLGLRLHSLEVRSPEDLDRGFEQAVAAGANALALTPGAAAGLDPGRIADLAAKSRLPSISVARRYAKAGLLMSYGADIADLHRRAAIYVDKILNGADPADLPVEQPRRYRLIVNLKTATALGITMPPSILLRANEVIE